VDIQPTNATVYAGTPFSYSVTVEGSQPFYYQWTRNGAAIAGATNSSYSFAVLQGTNYYSVIVSNSAGSMFPGASTATLVGIPAPTLSAANYSYKTKITFAGYNRGEVLSSFPALVLLGTNLPGFNYSQLASPSGGDLRFTDSSGTRVIPHEIDEWNPSGTSAVWVQVPSLSSTNDFIWAYWGNPADTSLPASSTNGTVWVPLAFLNQPAYGVVYHLKEGAFPFADSTTLHTATNGVAPTAAPGIIGTGAVFDGSRWLDAGTNNLDDSLTVSAWVNVAPTTLQIEAIWANQPGGYGAAGVALWVNDYNTADGVLDLASGNGAGSGNETKTGTGAVTFNTWHLIEAAINRTNGTSSFYIDGAHVLDGSGVVKDFTNNVDLLLGRFADGNFGMHGMMDEARVRLTTSSANWIWADYMTVAQNATFQNYGTVASSRVTLTYQVVNGNLVLSWPQGTLQAAATVNGTYSDISTATSPYSVPLTGPQRYFRVRVR
jgi:hypothetical protein